MTQVAPSLTTVGYTTKFQITGTQFVVSSKTVDIKIYAPDGSVGTAVGNVINDKLMTFDYTFPVGTTNGNATFEYSFDDKNSFSKSTINITVFGKKKKEKLKFFS